MRPYRGRGVLRLSECGGRTWIESRTFNPAHYVYQCMTILPDGMLGLLWEREMQGLHFTRSLWSGLRPRRSEHIAHPQRGDRRAPLHRPAALARLTATAHH